MSTGDLWGIIIGAVIGIPSLVLAIYFGVKQSQPLRHKLVWELVASPLFGDGHGDFRGALDVSVEGRGLQEPYFAILTLKNVGKSDIRSELFDQSRPIEFQILNKIAAIWPLNTPSFANAQGTIVRFGPELLHAGETWTVRIVADGKPYADLVKCHVADTEIIDAATHAAESIRWYNREMPTWAVRIARVTSAAFTVVGAFAIYIVILVLIHPPTQSQ